MKKAIIYLVAVFLLIVGSSYVFAATPDGTSGPWADSVVDEEQGLRKNNTPVNADRSEATAALGKAETSGAPYDSGFPGGSFYSLGFGGWVVLEFENSIVNGAGDDLRVYEVTGGSSYPLELVKVEASVDGAVWYPLGTVTKDGSVNLGDLECAHYVKLTDISNPTIHRSDGDGYDLDAVEAINWSEEAFPLNTL